MQKLSIIVPIYNVESELLRCLESIRNQDYPCVEVILIDDGSTDKSGEIAKKFAVANKNFKYVLKQNGGLSDARNFGMRFITGDLLMFVDSDDCLEGNSLEKLVSIFLKSNVQILIANAFRIKSGKRSKLRKHLEYLENKIVDGKTFIYESLLNADYIPTVWTNVYDVNFLRENNITFEKGLLHEDEDWFPRIMLEATRVKYVDYAFYLYMIRDDSITTKGDLFENAKSKLLIAKRLHELYEIDQTLCREQKMVLDNYLSEMVISTSSYVLKEWKEYYKLLDRKFVIKNAILNKTKMKAILFVISPKLYNYVHGFFIKNT